MIVMSSHTLESILHGLKPSSGCKEEGAQLWYKYNKHQIDKPQYKWDHCYEILEPSYSLHNPTS